MKLRLPARSFQYQPTESWAKRICWRLEHAIGPIGTVCLGLGVLAVFLRLTEAASYLVATGLLFHLVVWFSGWLGTGSSSSR